MIRMVEDYSDAGAWDQFVQNIPESRFCQLYGYAQAAATYGYGSRHIAFLQDDQILAVLPAAKAASLFFGRKLVSQPFSEYGGMLLSPRATDSDVAEIFVLARELLAHDQLPVLELHGAASLSRERRETHLIRANLRRNAVLDLSPSLDELWNDVLSRQVRKAVRKAEHSDLHVWQECNPTAIKNRFYPLYLQSMKRLGVPPHSVKYFLRCCSGLGDRMAIFWAARNSRPIAALMGFRCGDRVNITSTASDETAWECRPNDLLHWSYIRWAKEENLRYFDFGSVRYAGQTQFKKKWGCSFDEDSYYFLPSAESNRSRTRSFETSGRTMKSAARIWSSLVPKLVGRAIGPTLRKHLVR
jgi:CelD/BcsL family acetyltransferase involved in cellulose biosynthesis